MPSFIAASRDSLINQRENRKLAWKYNIQVSGYSASNELPPSADEFLHLLTDFQAFCERNQNTNCDMFLLTGYHGNYGRNGCLNNLNQDQLDELVKVANNYNVKFNHILADACCAPFGLKRLEGILANGGEAFGDRMTSTAFRFQEEFIKNLQNYGPSIVSTLSENQLISQVVQDVAVQFNAPLYVTKLGKEQETKAFGTTQSETEKYLCSFYRDMGLVDANLSDSDTITALYEAGLGEDLGLIRSDFEKCNRLFRVYEIEDRADLIDLYKLHHFMVDYLIKGLHKETVEETRSIGFFRVFHSKGINLVNEVNRYLLGQTQPINSTNTQALIDRINKHIEDNIQKNYPTSISKSLNKL